MEISMPIHHLRKENYSQYFEGIHPFVRQCGNDLRGRWSVKNRKLLDYLLIYIKEGEGVFSLERKKFVVQAGDLFCVPPNTLCSLEGKSNTMICPFVHFDLVYRNPESHWDFVIPENSLNIEHWHQFLHPTIEADSVFHRLSGYHRVMVGTRIGMLIEEICHDSAMMLPYYSVIQTGRMYEILGLLLKDILYRSADKPQVYERLAAVAPYVRRRIYQHPLGQSPVTAAECAELCCLSASYMRKVFPLVYGIGLRDYLVRMRMQYARELLQNRNLSVTKIALACGYDTIYCF